MLRDLKVKIRIIGLHEFQLLLESMTITFHIQSILEKFLSLSMSIHIQTSLDKQEVEEFLNQ